MKKMDQKMMKKTVTKIAHVLNVFVLGAASTVVLTHMQDARAQDYIQNVSEEQIHCLVQNIYFEARNQSNVGRKAVAWVTLNRVESDRYPDTICEVVWQDKQFSWTHDGLPDTPSQNVLEQKAWQDAQYLAQDVLLEKFNGAFDPTLGAIMYHADYVEPYWTASYQKTTQIEKHVFYN